MTAQFSKSDQWKQAIKDFKLRDLYNRVRENELMRRKSRKKLLIISLLYGSLITYLISQIL
ncbi:hypothetical protein BH10BAC2_BH10BAC2_02590 [soil metagenome]